MRKNGILFYLCLAICAIVIIGGTVLADHKYVTCDYLVVLNSPSEEQVLELYKSSSEDDKFWVRSVHSVKGVHSLLEATIGIRRVEGEERIERELEELGIEYYIVGKVREG